MGKQQCTVCGFVYDPRQGDHLSGIEPGTTFEELPEDWRCPLCRSGSSVFEGAAEEDAQGSPGQ
ncbi:MAG: rubredoxin [Desulfocurvibacter africanus]